MLVLLLVFWGYNLGGVFFGYVYFVLSYLIGDNILNVVVGFVVYVIDCYDLYYYYVYEGSSY